MKRIHFFIMGCIYLNIEIVVRALSQSLVGIKGIIPASLVGWTSLWMHPIGGICGLLIGGLNESPRFHKCTMLVQTLIGGTIIIVVEFLSGCILNLWLGLNVWDYSNSKYHLFGQINLTNSILWYFIVPFTVWLDDFLTHLFYPEKEPNPVNMFEYYRQLIDPREWFKKSESIA